MIVAPASLTVDKCSISENALGALIVLVALLSTTLTPHLLVRVEVLVNCNLVFLVFICLFYNTLNHFNTLSKIFIRICSDKDVQRLILVYLFLVVNTALLRCENSLFLSLQRLSFSNFC
jgi:hypothetical protein